jgi:hypothetical protein
MYIYIYIYMSLQICRYKYIYVYIYIYIGFVEMLSYRHGTKRIQANRAYQEYIGDKNHVHMNATIWTCLTDLCKYLGKEGIATVDETEKGWFIQYIDKDPRLLAKQLASEQNKKVEVGLTAEIYICIYIYT